MGFVEKSNFCPKVKLVENLAKEGVVGATDCRDDNGIFLSCFEKGDEFVMQVGDFVRIKDRGIDQTYCLVRLFEGDYYDQPSFETFQLSYLA